MNASDVKPGERVKEVRVTEDALSVDLMDGRTITVPLAWYPRLRLLVVGVFQEDVDQRPVEAVVDHLPAPVLAADDVEEAVDAGDLERVVGDGARALVADVVLLDQRGTGLSRPALICGKTWEHARDEPLDDSEARAAIRQAGLACAEQMGRLGVRLAAYNPREIADDVDALRQALGAKKVSLVATSFGTRLALEVLRRHGARVDRAVLLGVVGPDQEKAAEFGHVEPIEPLDEPTV